MTDIAEVLRGLPYFSDLPQLLLERVCRESERINVPTDQVIIEEGSLSEDMYVVVSGELRVSKRGQGRDVVLATLGPGEVVGEIALLDNAPRTASVTAATDATLIRIPADAFEALIGDSRVVRRMFRTVTSRLRGIEETLRHEERMAALGRMAAQLMHELNNPAAAVSRAMARSQDLYQALGDAAVKLASSGELANREIPSAQKRHDLDPLTRSELEDEMATWLRDLEVEDAWELAPALVADGFSVESLEETTEGLSTETKALFARWLGLRCLASQILDEARIAVGRISELVRVVKNYSYLDQAPIQEIHPAEGISDTLILLKHKLRGIETVLDIEPDLPNIEASGRDLNQVWTNLLDNAADAMDGQGTLTIRATQDEGQVVITISDTGGGIDAEVRDRIFDPFFTTKEPGKGTGLGLHTVHTIVTRSGGEIAVDSDGTGTTFTLRFPAASGKLMDAEMAPST
ncbi:MAG TPA: ATP-binding protein [Acidimicrobiia bacterium]|nr:ATP-binding protein [Acidimicrobiia bacterium]